MMFSRILLSAALVAAVCFACSANAALVHHYKLDGQTMGTAIDSAGSQNGVFTNSTGDARVAGLIGGAVQTNDESGDGGHFNMTLSGLDGATAGTWSMWFNLDTGEVNNNSTYNALFMTRDTTFDDGGGPLAGRNMGLALRNNTVPHRLDTRINGRGSSNATDIPANTWTHVALVWDGVAGTQKSYVNGVLEADQMEAQTIGQIVTGGEWNLADDPCCGNREIAATMDDVAVWDEALTPSAIRLIYTGGLTGIDASQAIPEPSSVVLGLMGACGFAAVAMRRRLG